MRGNHTEHILLIIRKVVDIEDIPLSTIIREAGYYHAHSPQTFAMGRQSKEQVDLMH